MQWRNETDFTNIKHNLIFMKIMINVFQIMHPKCNLIQSFSTGDHECKTRYSYAIIYLFKLNMAPKRKSYDFTTLEVSVKYNYDAMKYGRILLREF